ncbi:CW7 [Citrus sinensis]|uniref:CW7 n=2 Tax=Citrus sinensis TaxID=2711 RepID=A0ACB8KPN6_CITSI|nr:CW7 [Citrus sinensis]
MFGDRGETPSRSELLSMVKKHSNLLGKTLVEEQDAVDVEMDSRFWHDVFDLYFIRGKESRGRQDDDLLFFVRKVGLHGILFNDNEEDLTSYFVRRWAPKLDDLLGKNLSEVHWRRSFYLNMIAHTAFSVTVAICSHQELRNHQAGTDTPLSPIYKEVETKPAYPDICFAVDDFDSTFDAVVLSDTDHCYCVILNAHGGAAFPSEKEANNSSSSNSSPMKTDMDSGKTRNAKLTLFSGFVSYQMVREAYDAGKSRFGSLLSLSHSLGKTDRLYMKGPGGRGEVEVAVSGVAGRVVRAAALQLGGQQFEPPQCNCGDQSDQDSAPFSPVVSKRGFAIGSIVRKAASVASVAAKHAYAAAAATTTSDDEMLPLKCCLMSISLPWEHIAYDLLFKCSGKNIREYLLLLDLIALLKLCARSFARGLLRGFLLKEPCGRISPDSVTLRFPLLVLAIEILLSRQTSTRSNFWCL